MKSNLTGKNLLIFKGLNATEKEVKMITIGLLPLNVFTVNL